MGFKLLLVGLFVLVIASNGFASSCDEWTVHYIVENITDSSSSHEWTIHYFVNETSEPADSHEWIVHYYVAGGTVIVECDCPLAGSWVIDDGSDCVLTDTCELDGDLGIIDGSLTITSSGKLVLSKENKVIIERRIGNQVVVFTGGMLIINK